MQNRKLATSIVLLVLLMLFASACGEPDDEFTEDAADPDGFGGFQTAVASDRNYDIYWLGREFEAGGLVFKGPDAAGFRDDGVAFTGSVEGGGLGTYYLADVGDLKIVMYSPEAWDLIQTERAKGPSPRFEIKTVRVAGQDAEFRTILGSLNPIAARVLTIDYGGTVVEAVTGAYVPSTPGPQPNPLIDEATFLAVMENLRPYPQ